MILGNSPYPRLRVLGGPLNSPYGDLIMENYMETNIMGYIGFRV